MTRVNRQCGCDRGILNAGREREELLDSAAVTTVKGFEQQTCYSQLNAVGSMLKKLRSDVLPGHETEIHVEPTW
eukprot:CAMPEP_0172882634 /NCGR_PEP_ID=MMETSP1075-20121228/120589_1 /TAXON_ID=2916 /ORGANISM="Ceratium fusus, Strain PA161109" /LENGTH=73 /DNA_ID=CAMNT_0013735335 /DNA_START=220 /DNA_END=439 /DNA_ORIENTATION=-